MGGGGMGGGVGGYITICMMGVVRKIESVILVL